MGLIWAIFLMCFIKIHQIIYGLKAGGAGKIHFLVGTQNKNMNPSIIRDIYNNIRIFLSSHGFGILKALCDKI